MESSAWAFLGGFWSRSTNSNRSSPRPPEEPKSPAEADQSPLSPRLAHTLDLVVYALPRVAELVGQLGHGFHKRDVRHEFAVRIETAAYVLENLLVGLRDSEAQDIAAFETDINNLADCIETILTANVSESPQHEKHKRWWVRRPRLSAIRQSTADPLNAELAHQHLYDALASLSIADWRNLSQTLATLTSQLQNGGLDPSADKPLPTTLPAGDQPARPDWEFKDFIADALVAMVCSCQTKPSREMRVRLGTYKKSKGSRGVGHVTLLARDRLIDGWTEMRLHAASEYEVGSHMPKIRFFIPDDDEPPGMSAPMAENLKHPLKPGECVCRCLQRHFRVRPQYWRLNLQVKDRYFAGFWQDRRALTPESLQYQVSLKTLLSPQGTPLPSLAGMSLSVLLAYSLFYLFGQPLAESLWNRDNIVFFGEGDLIPLRPFLQVSHLPPTPSPPDGGGGYHRYPEFLELGVMLLEIYFRKSLEAILGFESRIETVDEWFAAASQVYHSYKWDISQPGLRQAIQSCLSLGVNATGLCEDGSDEFDNEEVRQQLFETVVQPLEKDLEGAFEGLISTKSLDEEASKKILLPYASPDSGTDPSGLGKPRPALLSAGAKRRSSVEEPPSSKLVKRPRQPRMSPSPGLVGQFTLFTTDTKAGDPSTSGCARTEDWMERFQVILNTHISTTSERLKVAVLDTGIDIRHPDFCDEDRLKERRSWVTSAADVDSSGHGTHIVSTILGLTQNVDVYIAKISEGNTVETEDQIAKAIKVVNEEWDVDIISLSFGFPRGFRNIRDEIEKAVHGGKVVFAAASNDGGNTTRAYPANQDGVICVHSSDGLGNSSAFNPTALDGTDNFCVVGENIEAAWPSSTPEKLRGTRYMSGTSFAVPVAVAIAALMIGFVGEKRPEHVDWLVPLRSFAGIKTVFHAMSERRNGRYDVVNPVKAFGSGTEPEQQKLLLDIQTRLDT